MGNNRKSAKDIAFDKERAKFRSEIRKLETVIRRLESENKEKSKEIERLQAEIECKESELAMKDDWIRRLLEYMDLSEDDMKKLIEKQKKETEIFENFQSIEKVFSGLFGRSYF